MRKPLAITLTVVSLLVIGTFLLCVYSHTIANAPQAAVGVSSKGEILDMAIDHQPISANLVFELVNEERAKASEPPLIHDVRLDKSALEKCNDMFSKRYWAHTAPDGTEPWALIQKNSIAYTSAGENLAKDFSDGKALMRSWMDSPSHRENIVSNKFTHVGQAVCSDYDGGQIVVQHFIGR